MLIYRVLLLGILSSLVLGDDDDDCPNCIPEACCIAQGDPHYTTFDGKMYDFQGMCEYLLAGDSVDDTWKVTVKHEPWFPGASVAVCHEVTVWYLDQKIIISRTDVKMNDDPDPIDVTVDPQAHGAASIYRVGPFIVVQLLMGVTVYYDQVYLVKVTVKSNWFEKTHGLCGIWDADLTDDNLLPDYYKTHAKYLFGAEWCDAPPQSTGCATQLEQEISERECREKVAPYACELDYEPMIRFCAYDNCVCCRPCLCAFVREYMALCYLQTRELKYLEDPCPGVVREPPPPNSTCPDGQFCPVYDEDCTVTGDPHFYIFDFLQYTFNGMGWYLLSKDDCDNEWEVHINIVPRVPGNDLCGVVPEVRIRINDQHIYLNVDGTVEVNHDTKSPLGVSTYHGTGFDVSVKNNIMYVYSAELGVEIFFGLYYLKLGLQNKWLNKVCGLCGTFNMDANDDRILSEPLHAHAWLIAGQGDKPVPNQEDCEREVYEDAVRQCESLLKALGEKCPELDVSLYMDFCVYDVCHCGEHCQCKTIVSFFTECFIKTGNAKGDLDYWTNKCKEPETGVCYASGDPHYMTFDGVLYHFQGICDYIFAADCVDDTFKVITENSPTFPGAQVSSVSKVTIHYEGKEIVMDRVQVMIDGVVVTLPYVDDVCSVIWEKGMVIVTLQIIGVIISYDMDKFISVEVGEMYKGKMCGLCGNYDGYTKDEEAMAADHQMVHDDYKHNALFCHSMPPSPMMCDPTERKEAEEICLNALKNIDCGFVDFLTVLESCILDVCVCGKACLCDNLRAYYHLCCEKTGDPKYEEDPCPESDSYLYAQCEAWGDPHYITFDKYRYDFQGVCWYTLAKDCSNSWAVETENRKRKPTDTFSYIVAVKVLIGGVEKLYMDESGTITAVSPEPACILNQIHLHVYVVNCWNGYGFEVEYNYADNSVIVVVDERWLGKTCGLCGNWNMWMGDDYRLGKPEVAHDDNVLPDKYNNTCNQPDHPELTEEQIEKGTIACQVLDRLDCPYDVIDDMRTGCIYDFGLCGQECLCKAVAAIAWACARASGNYSILDEWRDMVQVCTGENEKSAECCAQGDPHYVSFDGVRYDFQGMCEYVLAEDAVTGKWKVITDNDEWYPGATVSVIIKVTIICDDIIIIITQDAVYVNGVEVSMPHDVGNFMITQDGPDIVVTTNFGLKVTYNMKTRVKVIVSERWFDKTAGLCGYWNGNTTDDMDLISDMQELHEITLYGEDCGIPVVVPDPCDDEEKRAEAERECTKALEAVACDEVPWDKDLDFCIYDYCYCEDCMCIHVQSYVDSCYEATKDPQYNRDVCKEDDDKNYDTTAKCQATGDPHYSTFDGYRHHFQGMEQYIFAKHCDNESEWMVVTNNEPWQPGAHVSKVHDVYIIFADINICISQDQITINNKVIEDKDLPQYGPGCWYEVKREGMAVAVKTNFGLNVTYDQFSTICVEIDSRWEGKVCCLCGDWNGDTEYEEWLDSDHARMQEMCIYPPPNGTVIEDPPPPPECGDEMVKKRATEKCQEELEKYDCGIEIEDRIDQCVMDVCVCQPCYCEHVRAYVQLCYEKTGNEEYAKDPCDGREDQELKSYARIHGGAHIMTFDNYQYYVADLGWYIFARGMNASWEVQVNLIQAGIDVEAPIVGGVKVIMGGVVYEMDTTSNDVMRDGEKLQLPYGDGYCTIILRNGIIIMDAEMKYDLGITFGWSTLIVSTFERCFAKVDGLAGTWNMDINDDITIEENYLIYALDGAQNITDSGCTAEDIAYAENHCQLLRTYSDFCPEELIEDMIELCVHDVCRCKSACLCSVFCDAAMYCAFVEENFEIVNLWQDKVKICLGVDGRETAECWAWGDPHYTTFDGLQHHFQGMCEYKFSADCYNDPPVWEVLTDNVEWSAGSDVARVAEVTFKFYDLTIVINQDGVTLKGPPDVSLSLPVLTPEYVIQDLSDGDGPIAVMTDFGVKVVYDKLHYVHVTVDKRWFGKTCGLCGVYDDHQDNEAAMISSHQMMHDDFNTGNDPDPDCRIPLAQDPCNDTALRNESMMQCMEAFENITKCPEIDYTSYLDSCVYDVCVCGEDCRCLSLQAYYSECYDRTRDQYYLEKPCEFAKGYGFPCNGDAECEGDYQWCNTTTGVCDCIEHSQYKAETNECLPPYYVQSGSDPDVYLWMPEGMFKSWSDAKEFCESHDAKGRSGLAVIFNKEINADIAALTPAYYEAWIGLRQLSGTDYVWCDDDQTHITVQPDPPRYYNEDPPDGFQSWYSNNGGYEIDYFTPNNLDDQNCLVRFMNSETWTDFYCDRNLPFVCMLRC